MTVIKIPESAEEAVAQLGDVGAAMDRLTQLMTARKWQRAALVATLVGPGTGHGPGRGRLKAVELQAFPYSITSLAALGINGLRSNKTIAGYRDAWAKVRPIPDFGDEVELDGLPEWTGAFPEATMKRSPGTVSPNSSRSTSSTEQEYDTEAAAVRQAQRDGTVRIDGSHRWEPEQPPANAASHADAVEVRVTNNKDGAHIDVGIALQRLRDARRKRDEDYPTLNTYQKFGVRGNLTQIKTLIEELWPEINEAEEAVMSKKKQEQ